MDAQPITPHRLALFLKTKHIGDSIILTSAIEALPVDFQVDVLCFQDSEAIFKMHPRVRKVYVVPRHLKGFSKWLAYRKIFLEMRTAQYDLLAQFSDDWRGAYLARFLNVRLSVARQADKRGSIWTRSFDCIAKRPATDRAAAELDVDLLRRANLYQGVQAPAYRLFPLAKDTQAVSAWLDHQELQSQDIILIHASARWKFKGWLNESWVDVIDHLHQKGHTVVITGGANDFSFNQGIASRCQKVPKVTEKFSLGMTAALMAKARLLVSIDSMSIHMASAMRLPVIALFGPSNENIWGPWQVPARILPQNSSQSFICRPCGLDGCAGSKKSMCLYAITADQVLEQIDDLLTQTEPV